MSVLDARARCHPVVICDEHQDTSADQHRVVAAVHEKGAALRVFADPTQRIFGDRAAAAGCDWEALKDAADNGAALDTPHRWSRGCRDLGQWTLNARRSLRDGQDLYEMRGLLHEYGLVTHALPWGIVVDKGPRDETSLTVKEQVNKIRRRVADGE